MEKVFFVDGNPYRLLKKKKSGRVILTPMSEDEYVRSNPVVYSQIVKSAKAIKAGLGQKRELMHG